MHGIEHASRTQSDCKSLFPRHPQWAPSRRENAFTNLEAGVSSGIYESLESRVVRCGKLPYASSGCCSVSVAHAMVGVGVSGVQRGSPFQYPDTMIRWTAKFLLLVLLVGPFAPMAAALSMAPSAQAPVPADHCVRKPAGAMAPMPGCHHHEAATQSEPAHIPSAFRSANCCDGHECCRSMVRSLSADNSPQPVSAVVDRAETHVSQPQTPFASLEFVLYRSVRGPPAL